VGDLWRLWVLGGGSMRAWRARRSFARGFGFGEVGWVAIGRGSGDAAAVGASGRVVALCLGEFTSSWEV
jgi:hypothetical protein